jgi:hypothetical protein
MQEAVLENTVRLVKFARVIRSFRRSDSVREVNRAAAGAQPGGWEMEAGLSCETRGGDFDDLIDRRQKLARSPAQVCR